MNTLKKTVAVVLAVAMVLTMGIATSFAAFTDVQSTAGYAEAVNILSNLGILNGYDDGSFKPNNTITRAEVAAVMVRVLDLDPTPGATPFTDVPADHWASGYINAAYTAGVIDGYGDGRFGPENNVLYEQVVTMIVRALGYEPKAQQQGGYPTGYMGVGSSEKITQGANGTSGQPATRATVAKVVYNSLEVDMMEPVEYSTSGNKWAPVEGKTLLDKLGVEKLDVVVSDTYYTRAAESPESYDEDDTQVTLVSNKNKQSYKGDDSYDKGVTVGDFEEGGTAAASMLGMACVAYVGEDDDTGLDTIFAISAKGSKNTVTTVTSDRLLAADELKSNEDTKNKDGAVYYFRSGSSDRTSYVEPQTDGDDKITAKVYVNYVNGAEEYDFTTGTDFHDLLVGVDGESGKGGVVEFIDNDGDGDYNYAMVTMYTAEGVVDSAKFIDDMYYFTAMNGEIPTEYDPEEENVLRLFVKGENYIQPSEIAEGDTITTIGDESNSSIIIYQVSSDKVEGRSSSYDDVAKELTIAGKAYSKSPAYDKELSSFGNTTGTFYLNADGLISYVDGSTAATGNYGYVIGSLVNTSWKSSYEFKIVDANGLAQTYDLDDTITVVADADFIEAHTTQTVSDPDKTSHRVKAEVVHSWFEYPNYDNGDKDVNSDNIIDENGTDLPSSDLLANRIVKYTVSGGKITRLVLTQNYKQIEPSGSLERDYKYDEEDRTFGSSDPVNENTVFFSIGKDKVTDDDGSTTEVFKYDDEDFITVTKGYTGLIDGDEYQLVTCSENETVAAALMLNPKTSVALDEHVFVVTNVTTDVNEDDEDTATFTGLKGGTVTTFTTEEADIVDDVLDTIHHYQKGSVLMVGPEVGGLVEDITVLIDVTRNGTTLADIDDQTSNDNNSDGKKDIVSAFVPVQVQKDGNRDTYVDDNDRIQLGGYTPGKGYSPSSRTSVVLADYTTGRNFSGATVKNGSFSTFSSNANNYDFAVFFRAYDVDDAANFDIADEKNTVMDLVIYRVNDGEFNWDTEAGTVESYYEDDDDYDDGGIVVVPSDTVDDVDDVDDGDDTLVVTPSDDGERF